MKRLTCLILILTLLLGLGLPAVHAADVQIRDQVSHTNPLYPQVTENVPVTAPRLEADESGDIVYATSLEEAAVILRAQLEQRLATCVVHLAIPEYDRQQAHDVFRLALAHTGVPTQGDYLMWQYQSYSCSITGTGTSAGYELKFTYTMTYYTSPAQEAAVDAAVEDLLEDLALEGKSDYDAVLAIYDYITDHVTYDYDSDDTYLLQYTAYGALINGTSVCQGYAVLFYRLALECGIDTRLIAGTGGGGAHGWNIVELDGLYYDLDATWDAGRSEYNYFLRCEANFPDHRRYEEYDTAEFHAAYPMAQKDYRPNSQTPHTHQYTVDCVVPTCTKDGYTTTTCVTCGVTQTEILPATGHAYEDGKCVTCGEPDPSYVVLSAPVITSCYSKEQTSVKVTWTAVDGADGYQIYRSTSPDGSTGWQSIKTVKDGKQTSYTNQSLTVGVTYYYKVRAYIQNGSERIYSDFSEVKFMPAAVVWDGPYSNATFRIRLRWDAVGSAHGYQIWRQNADGSWSVVKTLGDRGNTLTNDQGDVTAYSNTGLTAGGKYTYKMRA
ncbi:MAG: hypothetical protein IIV61_00220, partial [Oscillospiraceae bacterium]|nr:hypothetical protein [Oscillospiraceae bacterium]